jgi:transketolase
VEHRRRPVALVLTRQDVPVLDRALYAPASLLERGGYVLAEAEGGRPELILIASGSEVGLAVEARLRLEAKGIAVRLVSMPSWELFDLQPEEYREGVLPRGVRARIAVEAGISQGWHKYVGDGGDIIALDRFGASAPGDTMFEKFGFTVDNVLERALRLVGK